jgi:NAD(P)-dependent dehydrogenase (short-subunit alcohol dehydrogenase family)
MLIASRTHLFIGKEGTEENLAGFVSTVPLGRPCQPKDVANTCAFLASDEAEFITGVNLEVSKFYSFLIMVFNQNANAIMC